MAVCTYLRGDEYLTPTSNNDLNKLLAELRQKTGRDWRLRERINETGALWWKRERKLYCLFLFVGGNPFFGDEYQIINLGHNDAETVEAYMLGWLEGLEKKGCEA